jgi:ABC-type transport system substrate-binding protein
VVAGADAAQSAFRRRHQGPGRLAHFLRAAGRLGRRRQPVPVLAAEIPTRENGGLAADGKSGHLEAEEGRQWHDGKPFTADDVVFNWEYAATRRPRR